MPFLERIVSLAVEGGFTGQITANSFMKREFGKKLIEEFFPRVDLTHVIDTSGAYIPGHGTPTVILFARNRRPVASTLRTVMGIRGEPVDARRSVEGAGLVGDRRADRPAGLSERIRERRRFAARAVPQASLVDRRRWGGGVEGAIGEAAELVKLANSSTSIGIHVVARSKTMLLHAACLGAAAVGAQIHRRRLCRRRRDPRLVDSSATRLLSSPMTSDYRPRSMRLRTAGLDCTVAASNCTRERIDVSE